jgi:hypothetical protein
MGSRKASDLTAFGGEPSLVVLAIAIRDCFGHALDAGKYYCLRGREESVAYRTEVLRQGRCRLLKLALLWEKDWTSLTPVGATN